MTNNKQQTVVEWLETQIRDLIPNDIGSQLKFKNKIKQAKEMEKDQHIKSWETGLMKVDFNEYYNETYGDDKQ